MRSWNPTVRWAAPLVLWAGSWTSAAVAQETTAIFTYFGMVRLPDGSPYAASGHSVRVTTKVLGQQLVGSLGATGTGLYVIPAVDLAASRAAIAGDSVRIELLDPRGIRIGSPARLQLVAADILAGRLRTDLDVLEVAFIVIAPPPRSIAPGQPETFAFLLRNLSNVTDSYDLAVSFPVAGWLDSSPPDVGPIAPGESSVIPVVLTGSPGVAVPQALEVSACSRLRPGTCQRAATATRSRPEPVDAAPETPRRLVLHPNRPNPFNPSTEIAFELPAAAIAAVDILDARGALLRSLLARPLAAGPHAVRWDGRDAAGRPVASGVYLYRLRAADRSLVRRLVLAR